MPSTYSNNLRFELPGAGEQSGSWGATTNVNIGTLIESAISGQATVNLTSANQPLTAFNGAEDEARCMVLTITSVAGVDSNVYIPPASKMYVVQNTSVYNATFYCSTGLGNTTPAGSGVTVPAGKSTIIWSDDTNVYSAVNSFASALETVFGGTGQTTYAAGEILVGNNAGTLTKATITGTANRVTVTSGSGSITLTTPQDTTTTSNLQFASLGIGTPPSGTPGEIRAINNITSFYSDDRLKTRLGKIENALDKLCSLDGFYYEANETAQAMGYKAVKEVGISAQQMQEVLPEVVAPAPVDDKYLTVRYERVLPLVIEAIKELRAEIAALKS
jgi:hypothetical protein